MTIQQDIAKIYVGYFGRSPEPEGFGYWIGEANRGFTASETAASFSVQQESTDRYPYLKNPNVADPVPFVTSVYQNLFNRAPDQEGLDFWVNKLTEAQGNPDAVGAMVLDIISGAQNTEEFGPDLDIITNKVAVALDWAQKTAEIPGFEYEFGSPAEASAKGVLDDVDETQASVDAAKAETDAFIDGGAGQTGNTITLTPNVDSGPAFFGTSGPDTFNGTGDTFNTGDDLNGGDGVDTLSIQAGAFQTIIAAPRLTGIENVEIQGGANNLFAQVDLTTSQGVEMAKLNGVGGTVEFLGVQSIIDGNVTNSSTPTPTTLFTGTTTFSIQYSAGAISGAEDVQKLELVNSALANLDIAGVENMEVSATGLNVVNSFNQAKSLKVDGAGDLVAGFTSSDTSSTPTATFDSTASTGNMAISFASGQQVVAKAGVGNDNFDLTNTTIVDVDGGDGNDIFFFDSGSGSLTSEDSVEGGEGKDTLVVDNTTTGSASIVNGTSSMEALQFASTVSTLVASDYNEADEFIFAGGPSNSRTNIDGVESDDLFVFASDLGNQDETVRFEGESVGTTLNMELRAAPNGSLRKDFTTVSDGEVVIRADTNSGNDVSAVGFQSNISSVNIASTGENTKANVIEAVDTGSFNYYAFGNQGGPNSFTITGSQALTIAAVEGVTLSSSSDTFGFEEAVNVNASDFEGVLRIVLSNQDDVLTGGSEADIIYGMSGDDRLTGDDGADQFRYVGTNGTDTILDFLVGTDKIGTNNVDYQNTTATTAGATLDSDDYIENRSSINDIGSADDETVIELQNGLSEGQITGDTTDSAVDAYVLVYNTTSDKGELWYDNNWSTTGSRDHIATFDNVVDLAGVQAFSNIDFVEFIA